jgi:hypothetical protein
VDGHRDKPKRCPRAGCDGPVTPTVRLPQAPDYWVRRVSVGRGWWYTFTSPRTGEVPSDFAYQCRGCGHTFRLVDPSSGSASSSSVVG